MKQAKTEVATVKTERVNSRDLSSKLTIDVEGQFSTIAVHSEAISLSTHHVT